MNNGTASYIWVIAAYAPNSDRGKSVLAHAEAGIGYVLQNKERSKTDRIIVAFKYPSWAGVPSHLTVADPFQSQRLEERTRNGR